MPIAASGLLALALLLAPLLAPARGWAASAPAIAWSPATSTGVYEFGTAGAIQTFTLTNTGSAATAALTITLSGEPATAFSKTSDTCAATSLGPNKTCTVTITYTGSSATATATLTALSKKPAAIATITLKANGDSDPPETTITSQPSDPSDSSAATFRFGGDDGTGSGVATFKCSLDGANFDGCTSEQTSTNLADGTHTFQVYAIDQAGNRDTSPATYTWTIDTTPPDTTITTKPPTTSHADTATFAFTATDTAGTGIDRIECKLDDNVVACQTGTDNTYTNLTDGPHTFQVHATDNAGNTTTVTHDWTIETYTQIAAGDAHTCALTRAGTVECWGHNGYGELGDGTTTNRSTPVLVDSLSGVTAIAAGGDHTCALTSTRTVKCWGNNVSGQLGDGTTTNRSTPVLVDSLSGVIAIAGGVFHTCAVTSTGTAKCWGLNNYGQLGTGSTGGRSGVAGDVIGPDGQPVNASAITAGYAHTCALTSTGTAKCWGLNDYGQLGTGSTGGSSGIAGDVIGPDGQPVSATAITAGLFHACVLTSTGTAKCWGLNDYGQLGTGSTGGSSIAGDVIGPDGQPVNATAITAGGHTCAVTSTATAKCWGWNLNGQLGTGSTGGSSSIAGDVIGPDGQPVNASAITAGYRHTCVLTSTGTAKCWGWNLYGQLGNGTTTDSSVPVDVV